MFLTSEEAFQRMVRFFQQAKGGSFTRTKPLGNGNLGAENCAASATLTLLGGFLTQFLLGAEPVLLGVAVLKSALRPIVAGKLLYLIAAGQVC